MFFRNSRKILSAALAISVFFPACRFWQKSENRITDSKPTATDALLGGDAPFTTAEPETYQAELVVRTDAGGEQSERKTLTARSGNRRLTVFDWKEKNEISSLNLGESSFSIFRAGKVYAENKNGNFPAGADEDFLTTARLNEKTSVSFENLGAENGVTKFRARLGESENSEILIYFDENLKIPVRQEFYATGGGQKILTFSVVVENFKLAADEKLFELPQDYRQISPKEFQEIIRRAK